MLGAGSSAVTIIDSGTLQLAYGTYVAPQATVAASGQVVGLGTIIDAVSVNGVIESNGGLLVLGGGASGRGTLLIDAGSKMELRANSSVGQFIANGTLQLTGYQLSINNTSTVAAGGLVAGVGWITNALANSGTIEASGPGQLTLGHGATGGGTLLVDAGSEMDLRGATAAGSLIDTGLLKLFGATATITAASVSSSGTAEGFGTFQGAFTDNGVVEAAAGRLALGAVGGDGVLRIANASTLELIGATSLDATFLSGAVGSVALDAPAQFIGVIGNLALHDTLVFKNELISTATLSGSTLSVVGSTGTTDLQVAGALAGATFSVSTDHHTLTLVATAHG